MRLVHVFVRALCRWVWIKVPLHVKIATFTGIGVCTGGPLLFHTGAKLTDAPIAMAISGMGNIADDPRDASPLSGGDAIDGHMPVAEDASPQTATPATGGSYLLFPEGPRAASRSALLAPLLSATLDPILDPILEPPADGDPADPGDPAGPGPRRRVAVLQVDAASQAADIPEPGSAMLLLPGLFGLFLAVHGKTKRAARGG